MTVPERYLGFDVPGPRGGLESYNQTLYWSHHTQSLSQHSLQPQKFKSWRL